MFLIASTFVLIIIAFGLYYRKQAKVHIPLMISAFVFDVILVLVIEFQRKAVEDVIDNALHSPDTFVLFHAAISLLVIVLYILLSYTGSKLLRADLNEKQALLAMHQKLALLFIVLRLTNYITSFDMAERILG